MGCANCPRNITSQGVVVISEPSLPEEDCMKIFSLEKNKENNAIFSFSTKERVEKSTQILKEASLSEVFPSTAMLREINKARTNPLSYIDKIEQLKKCIVTKNNHSFLLIKNKNKININLNKGVQSFNNCVAYLRTLSTKPKLSPLVMKEELKVPFPINSPELCVNKDYIRNVIVFKTEENRDKFSIIDFHYDICYDNIELSVILQIIDDTNSNYQRRKNIFNPKARYIGITEGNLWDYMKCYYLLFAE